MTRTRAPKFVLFFLGIVIIPSPQIMTHMYMQFQDLIIFRQPVVKNTDFGVRPELAVLLLSLTLGKSLSKLQFGEIVSVWSFPVETN